MFKVARSILVLILGSILGGTAGCVSALTTLANVPSVFGKYQTTRNISYGAAPRQRLDVYRPANAQSPRPVVVFVYGGGWRSGSKANYRFVADALISRQLRIGRSNGAK